MIELNGKKLALNDSEFTGSLFDKGGTCVGYYKINKASISILDMQKNKVGVINKHGVLGSATKVDNGYWYSEADIKRIGEYGSYIQKVEDFTSLPVELIGVGPGRKEIVSR